MGIWGYGNFERDDALNVLDDVYDYIIRDIKETFAQESEKTLYGDFGENHIVANLDILITLTQHYRVYPNIEPEALMRWKQDYITTFERTIHQYSDSKDYIEKRKAVVVATFDKLYGLLKQPDKE